MEKHHHLHPAVFGALFFVAAQALALITTSRLASFLETNDIYFPPPGPPGEIILWPQPGEPAFTALGPILIYFFAVVVALGVILFLIPVSALKVLLRVLFGLVFAWAFFILLIFWLPFWVTLAVAVAVGLGWLFVPRVWLHNLAMLAAMVSVGAIFGRIISPWTAMVLLLVLAGYDLVAVRFGYMMWMSRRLSAMVALPAFLVPRHGPDWNAALSRFSSLEEGPAERDYSILGGGDIAFPVLLVAAAFFAYGLGPAIMLSLFTLGGLIAAYLIQLWFLKGRPMPALPPIAILSLAGLIVIGQL